MAKTLITAALPYVNSYIHLGHLAGAYLPADMYARFLRLSGREVLFVCGSDEHGVAITISAEKEKTEEEKEDGFSRKEYNYNSFSRSFSIPEDTLTDKIDANYINGELKLLLPKKEGAKKLFHQKISVH